MLPTIALLAGLPAVVAVLVGVALVRKRSWWGIRLMGLAFALVNLLPGAVLVGAATIGQLAAPAAIVGWVAILLGVLLLAIVRKNWTVSSTWPSPGK